MKNLVWIILTLLAVWLFVRALYLAAAIRADRRNSFRNKKDKL